MARRAKGDGSIYRDSHGYFVFRITSTGMDGIDRRYTRKAKTLKEVQSKAKELRRQLETGVSPDGTTLDDWITYWKDHIIARKIKPSTLRGYESKINNYISPKLGSKKLIGLSASDIRSLHEWMLDDLKLSTGSVRQTHAILSAALRVAEDEGKIMRNPCRLRAAQPPTVISNPYPILSASDAAKVIDSCSDARMKARLVIALMCGLRQGEALGLEWVDVHESDARPTLFVRQALTQASGGGHEIGTPKSRRSIREVPLFPAAADVISRWRTESTGTGFVFPAEPGTVPTKWRDPSRDAKDWKAALAAAGVGHVPLHGARGTLATILMAQGVPDRVIADILGHDVQVDQRHYQHSDDTQRRNAINLAAHAIGND